ncbi:hypothetical protein WME81_11855 [Sorangium sp. So ce1078]
MLAHRSVLTTPGQTAFTRMGASSTESALASDSIAPQMLAPRAQPARGRSVAIPDVKTAVAKPIPDSPPRRTTRLPLKVM